MSISLPNSTTASTDSNATIAAMTSAAQAAFIASATVLINNAISNGLFLVQPYLPPLVTSAYVTTYFENLGYSVLFPIIPPGPFDYCMMPAGFPEVIPPGWVPWNCGCGQCGPLRIQISWPTT